MSLIVGSLGKGDFSGKDLRLHNHVLPRYVGVCLVSGYVCTMERGFQVWKSSSLLFLKPFKRQRKRMENGLPKPHEDMYVCICSFLLSLHIKKAFT